MKSCIGKRNKQTILLALLLAGIVSLAAFQAGARDRVAKFDTAAPVATVSEEMLDRGKWTLPEDTLTRAPGITPSSTSSTTSRIQLRGFGDSGNPATSPLFMVNGRRVPAVPDINPADIGRIEVINGPASAVYGSDAIAGVVNIITKTPRTEGRDSFENPGGSRFRADPFQAGFRSMAAAKVDPVGQSVYSYYDYGGRSGIGAGAMFASSVKLRWDFGGPLCDRPDAAVQWGEEFSEQQAGQCLADEIIAIQSLYDSSLGSAAPTQQRGDFLATGLYGLGFDRNLAGDTARTHVPGWPGWETGTFGPDWGSGDFRIDPATIDHLLDYVPGRKHALPARDDSRASWGPVFGEANLETYSQEMVRPNDPLYKKPDSVAREAGGVLKKGLGALLKAGGFGVQTANEDSKADDQWGLHTVGFTPMGTGESAWDVIEGKKTNVVVAVIDSGLDPTHPDRPRDLWTNPHEIPGNGIDDDTNGYVDDINGWNFVAESNDIDDDYGHGTFVAGIIAANTDNGEGIAGVNPGARIMTLKVSNSNGVARSLAIYRAIRYAVDNGARVINISLGRKGLSRLEQIGINYAYAMGSLVVVAAGNQGGDIARYGPPGARRIIAVASLNIDGTRRSQSNQGLGVALAAPGESVYSLTAKNGKRDGRMIPIAAGDYHRLNGTSFAAPFVAGTASLIWAHHPQLSNRQVTDLILASATDTEEPEWDAKTGMGKLNARTAVSMRPETAFAPRITDWIINRDARGKVASVDVYGVIRGPVASYAIAVGPGNKPSKWTPAYGPANRTVDHGHIARLSGRYFKKGSRWSLQLAATAQDGQRRIQIVEVRKDG